MDLMRIFIKIMYMFITLIGIMALEGQTIKMQILFCILIMYRWIPPAILKHSPVSTSFHLLIHRLTVIIYSITFQKSCIIQTRTAFVHIIYTTSNHHIWFRQFALPFSAFFRFTAYMIHLDWWNLSIHSCISTEEMQYRIMYLCDKHHRKRRHTRPYLIHPVSSCFYR